MKFRESALLIWPIIYSSSFPDYIEGHEKIRMVSHPVFCVEISDRLSFPTQARRAHANMVQEAGILETLGKSRGEQQPFDMNELCFHLQ